MSEALVHLVYTFHDTSINYFIDNEAIVNNDYLDQIKTFIAKNPRAPHMIQRDTPVSKEFFKLMS